jgi:hypothetical protein
MSSYWALDFDGTRDSFRSYPTPVMSQYSAEGEGITRRARNS